MNNIELKTAWRTVRAKGSDIPLHSHDYYELVYYDSGYGSTGIGDSCYEFAGRRFVLIAPGMMHDEKHPVEGGVTVIGFCAKDALPCGFYRDENGSIGKVVREILEESICQGSCYQEMLAVKLNELAVWIKRLSQNQTGRFQARSFEYVINYLAENYHEKIQLKELAAQMNFSYDYFQHRFKELQGVSPQQFLMQRRVSAAAAMLQEEKAGCTEVALRCGFSNSAQFSAVFKREMGMTPREYAGKRSGIGEAIR